MRKVYGWLPSTEQQQGAALATVLILMALLVVLSFAAYQISANKQSLIAWATGGDKALYAAEQGYNRCLWRLNNEGYKFLKTEDDTPANITLDSKDYHRYDLTPGSNYRLQVLVPLVVVPGQTGLQENKNNCVVRSTGWDNKHPDRLRTIEVEVKRSTFTQYTMANDTEEYNGTPLYWVPGETVYGPLHTNDVLYVRVGVTGTPVFHGLVTYVNGIHVDPSSLQNTTINNPDVFRQGNLKVPERLNFPPSNPELLAYARIDGHYYNGRTCITLLENKYNVRTYNQRTSRWYYNGCEYEFNKKRTPLEHWWEPTYWWANEIENEAATNSSKEMFVKVTRNNADQVISRTPFSSFAAFASTCPSLDLPENGVIYVDGATGNGDNGDFNHQNKYDITLGNVFVYGQLDGRLTIAAANDIYLVGHDATDWKKPPLLFSWSWFDPSPGVTYSTTTFEQIFDADNKWTHTEVAGEGDDMLGLVANRRVQVLHYNWPSQYHDVRYALSLTSWFAYDYYCWTFANGPIAEDRAPRNMYVYAAIYARDECFGFEASQVGQSRDTIYMVGSIAQKYRGPVGSSGLIFQFDGYTKDYSHDPRMLYDAPPHFPTPTNMGYRTVHWNESSNHMEAPVPASP